MFKKKKKDDEEKEDLLAKLQAKVNAHNEAIEQEEGIENGIWADDPGDGTDFIIMVDLPIEDQGALPTYDIFDNPTTPVTPVTPSTFQPQQRNETVARPNYNFDNLI